jgi:hypothetical protein
MQAEVINGAILQQAFVVEFVVEDHMCPDCTRRAVNPNQWVACVQACSALAVLDIPSASSLVQLSRTSVKRRFRNLPTLITLRYLMMGLFGMLSGFGMRNPANPAFCARLRLRRMPVLHFHPVAMSIIVWTPELSQHP